AAERHRGAGRAQGAAGVRRHARRPGFHGARRLRWLRPRGRQRTARLPTLRAASTGNAAGTPMKGWLRRLSLRYKLTLAALAVEAVMLSFLIANGVQLSTQV